MEKTFKETLKKNRRHAEKQANILDREKEKNASEADKQLRNEMETLAKEKLPQHKQTLLDASKKNKSSEIIWTTVETHTLSPRHYYLRDATKTLIETELDLEVSAHQREFDNYDDTAPAHSRYSYGLYLKVTIPK